MICIYRIIFKCVRYSTIWIALVCFLQRNNYCRVSVTFSALNVLSRIEAIVLKVINCSQTNLCSSQSSAEETRCRTWQQRRGPCMVLRWSRCWYSRERWTLSIPAWWLDRGLTAWGAERSSPIPRYWWSNEAHASSSPPPFPLTVRVAKRRACVVQWNRMQPLELKARDKLQGATCDIQQWRRSCYSGDLDKGVFIGAWWTSLVAANKTLF